MHELSLMQAVREIVEDASQQWQFRRVRRVVLAIGQLAGVDAEALRFCHDAVMEGSIAEGSVLVIRQVPGRAWCDVCRTAVDAESHLSPCPVCGGPLGRSTEGTGMSVESLDVE